MIDISTIHHTQAAYSYFVAAGIVLVLLFIWLRVDTRLARQTQEESCEPDDWKWPNV